MLTPINWRTACFLSIRSTLYWPPQNSKQNLWMTIKHPSIDLYLNNLPRHNPMNTKKCKYQAHNCLTSMQCKSKWSTDSPLALPIQLQLTRATTLLMMSKSNADIKWCQSFIVTPNTYDSCYTYHGTNITITSIHIKSLWLTAPFTATSRSASSKTIQGALPPSSRDT